MNVIDSKLSSANGNVERSFNLPHLMAVAGATYVARWTRQDDTWKLRSTETGGAESLDTDVKAEYDRCVGR